MTDNKYLDEYGKNTEDLKNKRLFLFDMDGTIFEEERLFDGSLELLDKILEMGGRYVFITNNSSKSVVDHIKKTNRLGIKATEEDFFTSLQATIIYILENYKGKKIYAQGTKSFIKELRDNGIEVTESVDDDAQAVLVGFDTELTSEKVRNTCEMLSRDIPFIATNKDLRCPASFGFIPDCGSICSMITNATGRKPKFIGKPERTVVDILRKKFNYTADETVVIGDRLYTDIEAGLRAEVSAVAVLTGEATIKEIDEGNIKPTYTFKSVKEMYEALC